MKKVKKITHKKVKAIVASPEASHSAGGQDDATTTANQQAPTHVQRSAAESERPTVVAGPKPRSIQNKQRRSKKEQLLTF